MNLKTCKNVILKNQLMNITKQKKENMEYHQNVKYV